MIKEIITKFASDLFPVLFSFRDFSSSPVCASTVLHLVSICCYLIPSHRSLWRKKQPFKRKAFLLKSFSFVFSFSFVWCVEDFSYGYWQCHETILEIADAVGVHKKMVLLNITLSVVFLFVLSNLFSLLFLWGYFDVKKAENHLTEERIWSTLYSQWQCSSSRNLFFKSLFFPIIFYFHSQFIVFIKNFRFLRHHFNVHYFKSESIWQSLYFLKLLMKKKKMRRKSIFFFFYWTVLSLKTKMIFCYKIAFIVILWITHLETSTSKNSYKREKYNLKINKHDGQSWWATNWVRTSRCSISSASYFLQHQNNVVQLSNVRKSISRLTNSWNKKCAKLSTSNFFQPSWD